MDKIKQEMLIRSILDMRFGDGSGQPNLQINIATKELLSLFSSALDTVEREIIEKINMDVRRFTGQWEAQTIEWVEGNKKAFSNVINYLDSLSKNSKGGKGYVSK